MLKHTGLALLFILIFFSSHSYSITAVQYIGKWVGNITKNDAVWNVETNFYLEAKNLQGYFNIPDYGLYHLKFTTITFSDSVIHLEYIDKNSKVTFDGNKSNSSISGKWEGIGTTADFVIYKESVQPELYKTIDISFGSDSALLSGTLIIPDQPGPFPAVVMIHGSGNQTRNEEFYRSRGYLLAKNGIVSLIYDRRGKGNSTGDKVSMELLAKDVAAGVKYLSGLTYVKKDKIGILGVSQGGYVSPLAASLSKDISFMIVVSAPGITPNEQNDFDVENKLKRKNVSQDSIAFVLKLRKDIREFQYNGTGDISELESSIKKIKDKSWFKFTMLDTTVSGVSAGEKDFLTFDPVPFWEKIKIPVLAIWGELDQLVPAQKSKDIIEVALKNGMNRKYELKIFANSNHGIAEVHNDKEFYWPSLASGYHSLIISWIKSTTY